LVGNDLRHRAATRKVERFGQPVDEDDDRHQKKSAANNRSPKEAGDRGHRVPLPIPRGEVSFIVRRLGRTYAIACAASVLEFI
jgi:hypothetical protein